MSVPSALAAPDIRIESFLEEGEASTLADDVRRGLTAPYKELMPKYLYDARGSELFDRITEQPEYYPTRCERSIIVRQAPAIVNMAGAEELVELGSGTASKTRALLFAMAGAGRLRRYVPFDVDRSVIEASAEELTEALPGLAVHGVVGDFERHLDSIPNGERRLVAFLGGTIGNLPPAERAAMLRRLRALLGPEDRLLLGAGLVTDVQRMEAAYDDAAGITAEFERNILHVLNRELGADFDVGAFSYVVRFDPQNSWIEMGLRSDRAQRVRVEGLGLEVDFAAGEEMRTEISAKFTREQLAEELDGAGLVLEGFFTDPENLFSLTVSAPA